MKIAVIDLGTNTFNLLISENNPGRALPIVLEKNPVKLGLGFSNNRINQETLNRAFDCLQEYKNLIILNNVKKCIAFGTSALRSAENGRVIDSV
jgi:exopolyphosphatase/guanosine-5'-triphosphate,3'-diphosphate pyrophosphatase